MRLLVFDIWGDYGHFKKYYTTSSPLTFSIPPRTAVIGLISAILGYGKDEYFDIMRKSSAHIAIRIVNPIKKVRIGINLIDTKVGWIPVKKGKLTGRTQVLFEFLKEPKYRIYFSHNDEEIYNKFKYFLENHKSVYTPYLGISELICDFRFIGEFKVSKILESKEFVEINSIAPLDEGIEFDLLHPGRRYFKEKIPTEILSDRIVTEYRDVLFEMNGRSVKGKFKKAFRLDNEDIIVII